MKTSDVSKILTSIILLLFAFSAFPIDKKASVTPKPVEVMVGTEILDLSRPFFITFNNVDSINTCRLRSYATQQQPRLFKVPDEPEKSIEINMSINENVPELSNREGYRLLLAPESVDITATHPEGLFYGLITFLQLAEDADSLPSMEIIDYPRFEYRGIMLDISRHFRDKEFIKKQIDAFAKLKINRLHLHLTDAAGWRIEIKRYPELTRYAAWRPQETWKEWADAGHRYIDGSSQFAHGGYLSQDDAREIVEYAADRFVTVIPEIEMPSHSEEITATYSWLSCDGELHPDVCIGKETTYEFFENVLDEITDIFPSEYIHIGGDEASKRAWKECGHCQELMEKEGFTSMEQLQSYMIARIEKYLESKGRKIIGWDEIVDGELTPGATVMSWRGTEGGIKAAEKGNNVIMTPGGYCYFDSYQDAPPTQPEAISGYTPLSKVYSYDPLPDSLRAATGASIIGVQGNLWCEYIPTAQHAEYMLYPRTIALAEVGWTPQEAREWDDFYSRALKLNDCLQRSGYHVFDLKGEIGNRREALMPVNHLALGKKVTYNRPWWRNYNAAYDKTLTDGERGSWSYGDGRWQGFVSGTDKRVDVTIDLEKEEDISYIGADFMQIIGPGVWLPSEVIISVSTDGKNFLPLATIQHEQKSTAGLSFKAFEWSGEARARYVRYVANSNKGCLFTDEIIIR